MRKLLLFVSFVVLSLSVIAQVPTITSFSPTSAKAGESVTIVGTGFNTTIQNTLSVTAQWGAASVNNSIYSDIFTLNKTF